MRLCVTVVLIVLVGGLLGAVAPAGAAAPQVLVVAGPSGGSGVADRAVAALSDAAAGLGVEVSVLRAPTTVPVDRIREADAVVLAAAEGTVLTPDAEQALNTRVQDGAGLFVLGAAVGAQPESAVFGELAGARPRGTGPVADAEVQVVDRAHPATQSLPRRWNVSDRWVPLDHNPAGDVHVLAWVDERSYGPTEAESMGLEHPVVWCQQRGAGRSLTSLLGQAAGSFDDPAMGDHLEGALAFVAGLQSGDCGATVWSNWRKTTIDDQITDGTELEVSPDGRVYYTEHVGSTLRVYDPETGVATVAGAIPSAFGIEGGLLGLALDPGFMDNGWVYTFRHVGVFDVRISRWTLIADRMVLDPSSEVVVLPLTMRFVGHQGGGLEFGPDGNLYIAIGDNTNGGCCNGYPTTDERPEGEGGFFAGYDTDAQHSAANTNSLLGKVLRIHPEPDGTYSIPEGNLFPPGTPLTRPEIYTMGHRNVFHIKLDSETGDLLWGDVGNDALAEDPTRGPRGHDEFNRTAGPGNFGWPYCIGDNMAYQDYDFATGTSRGAYDCNRPVNDSPRNTGLQELPSAQPALIWYPYDEGEDFPELGIGARVAIPGPIFHNEEAPGGSMPAFFDDTWFIADLARSWIKQVIFDDDDGGVLRIQGFAPELSPVGPIDMDIAPDGSIYVMEFGGRTQLAGDPTVAKVSRYEYLGSTAQHAPADTPASASPQEVPAVPAMASIALVGVLAVGWVRRTRHA